MIYYTKKFSSNTYTFIFMDKKLIAKYVKKD